MLSVTQINHISWDSAVGNAFMTNDERLEKDIEAAFQDFMRESEDHKMRLALDRMRSLIAKRSPAQVDKMETAMGLR